MQNDAFKKAYEALQEERERTMTFMQKHDGQKQLSKRKKAITRLFINRSHQRCSSHQDAA